MVAAISLSAVTAATGGYEYGQRSGFDAASDDGSVISQGILQSQILGGPEKITASPSPSPSPSPSAEASPSPSPTPEPKDCLADLPLELRVGQLIMPGINMADKAKLIPVFKQYEVGNALIMKPQANLDDGQINELKDSTDIPLMIASDEEGGSVQRLKGLGRLPGAQTVATTMSPAESQTLWADYGQKMIALGVDVAFGPVVDVSPINGTGPIKDRAFSSDPQIVSDYAGAASRGLIAAGVLPVLKHAPGHGSASADSHLESAQAPPLKDLRERDLLPYATLADLEPGVMMGHLKSTGLGDKPASLNSAAIAMMRTEYGYSQSLIFSDALDMDAIDVGENLTLPEATVEAIKAGDDVAVYVATTEMADFETEIKNITGALSTAVIDGNLSQDRVNEAVSRVLDHKQIDPCSIKY